MLFDNGHEEVRIEAWRAGETVDIENPRGLELLVRDGSFFDGTEALGRYSWLRLPPRIGLHAQVGMDGARVWLKAGALLQDNVCAF